MKATIQCHNFIFYVLSLVWCVCLVAPVSADFPKPLALPGSEKLVPIAANNDSATASLKSIEEIHGHIPVLIEQMLSRKLTPRQAWDEKLLSVDDMLWIFTSYIDPWGSFNWKFDIEVRRDLARLLSETGDEKLRPLEKLSPNVRLWLADYTMSIGDEQTIKIGESILSEIKKREPDENALAFQTIERMARYYVDIGELEKGAKTWLRVADYYAQTSRFVPDYLIEAARVHHLMGQDAEARLFYSQVSQYDNSWLSSIAVIDQARMLLNKNKLAEARELLQQELIRCEETIKPVILALIGKSYYQEQNFAKAQQVSLEAIEKFKKTKDQNKKSALDSLINSAESRAKWSEKWTKSTFVCQPAEFNVTIHQDESAVMRTLLIRSPRPMPIAVICNNPHVIIQVAKDVLKEDIFAQSTVRIQINAEASKFSATELTVSSPQFPDTKIKVPLKIEHAKTILVSDPILFFGSVQGKQAVVKVFKLSSRTPFRIMSVQSDNPTVSVEAETTKATNDHNVKVTLAPAEPSRFYSGNIRINTDRPRQEVIEVEFAARS